jgi:biofilm PGA synthesis N-glycosyltransferase PgaC
MALIALVPAHNEEDSIVETLSSLANQDTPPSKIIVVADNCTDATVTLVHMFAMTREYPTVEVFITSNNRDKKAGALNQCLAALLPSLHDDDFILVQDADSQLDADFITNALSHLYTDSQLGAVGGVFRGATQPRSFVAHLQRNEYARYARDVARLRGRCLVVTGTAAVFRVATLHHVSNSRLAGTLPQGNGRGGVYDTTVLTEDNELSFALQTLGYRILSPANCLLTTEVMPSWRALYRQRLRWKRGAVENCVQYGLTRVTARYWGRQLFTALGILVTAIYLLSIPLSVIIYHGINVQPIWLAVTAIFVLERVITVRYRGFKHMMLAATMYEMVTIDLFLQAVHAKAYFDALFNRKRNW